MFERIRCIIIKEFLQMLRDPMMKIPLFIAPLVQIVIFGYAANTDVTNIRTAVYDLDNTKESRELVRDFTYSKYFKEDYFIGNDREMRDLIDKALVDIVIRINRGFGADVQGNKEAQVQLIVDGTDSNTASVVLGYANQVIERYSSGLLQKRITALPVRISGFPQADLMVRTWFNENLISREYFVPGIIALIVTLISLLLTAMAIVREKEIGTMEQLIVSPIRPFELILGKMMPFAVISLIDVVLITLVGIYWFGVPMRGDLSVLFISTIVYLLAALGIGLFISTISSTQQEALMSTFLFIFPAVLLSGFIFPIENMPKIVQYLTYVNPLRYYLVIIRGVFLKGVGMKILLPQVLSLMAIGTGILLLSTLRFRKRIG